MTPAPRTRGVRKLQLLTLAAALPCTTPAVVGAQRSLNLDFEIRSIEKPSAPAKWNIPEASPPGSVALDSSVRHGGRLSLRLSRAGGVRGPIQATVPLDLERRFTGQRVRLSAWMSADSAPPVLRIIQWRNDQPIHRDTSMLPVGEPGAWRRLTVEATLDSTADDLSLMVAMPHVGRAWVDDVSIEVGGRAVTTDPRFDVPITTEQIDWARRNTRPLSGVDPGLGTADLDPLASALHDARVIGLGEAMHGSSEFRQFDTRFVAWAVQRLGVRLIILEENAVKAQRLNAFVHGADADPAWLVHNTYDMWRNAETLRLLSWIRTHNATAREQVDIAGMDIIDGKPEADSVLSVLRRVDPAYARDVAPVYEQVSRIWRDEIFPKGFVKTARDVLDDSTRMRLEGETGLIAQRIEANQTRYAAASDTEAAAWLVRNAAAAHRNVMWLAPERASDDRGFRDSVMALNVGWALARWPANTKAIILSHDGHVGKQPRRLGGRLSREMGSSYRVIGMTAYGGATGADTSAGRPLAIRGFVSMPLIPAPGGTLEGTMHAAGIQYGWLDVAAAAREPAGNVLRETVLFRYDAQQLNDNPFWSQRIIDWLDWVVYIDQSSAIHYLPCRAGEVCGG
jgi:erythromycin esterase-like protein